MDSSAAGTWRHRLLAFALPALATLPRFRNGFVFDDVFVIERGEFIHRWANLPRAFGEHTMAASSLDQVVGKPAMDTYRPISIATFFWDAAVSGRQPFSYHLTNLILHGVACVLVLELLGRLLPALSARLRLTLTLCFGFSPWLSEAHVFINGRSDPLLAVFFVGALLTFRTGLAQRRGGLGALAGVSLLLALLSKEIAVVLAPFVVAVPTPQGVPWRERARRSWPVLLAVALYLAMRFAALSGLRSHSDAQQLALALRQLPLLWMDGVAHALLPSPYVLRSLRDDYADASGWQIALCSAASALLVAGALWSLRRRYVLGWALSLSLAALAPAAMISTALWPGFGRYLYVPAVGLCVALGELLLWLTSRFARSERMVTIVTCTIAFASACLLVEATLAFADEPTMYARSIQHAPQQAWGYGFMGMALRRAERCQEAIPFLNKAATLDAKDARYAVHLGRCLVDVGARSAALDVAMRGRSAFQGTRSEPGFIVIEVLALPASEGARQERALERCLHIDPLRTDCSTLLEAVRARAAGRTAPPGHLPKR